MSNDPTPWDLAMEAIEDRGCDCDGDPEDTADHTCIAGRCEHALLTERAARDEARKERDALRADLTRVGEWYSAAMKEIGKLAAERDAAAAKERAAVVAWLAESSGRIESMRNEFGPPTYSEVCQYVADAIEAGDHLDVTRA